MWENQETEPAEPADEPEEEALWENPLVMFWFVFLGAFSINDGKLATKILGYNPEMMLKTTRPKARRKRRRSPKRARPGASTRSLPRNRKDWHHKHPPTIQLRVNHVEGSRIPSAWAHSISPLFWVGFVGPLSEGRAFPSFCLKIPCPKSHAWSFNIIYFPHWNGKFDFYWGILPHLWTNPLWFAGFSSYCPGRWELSWRKSWMKQKANPSRKRGTPGNPTVLPAL